MDFWKVLFNGSGNKGEVNGKLSRQQCEAANIIFGSSIPDLEKKCSLNYPTMAKQVYKEVMTSDDIRGKLQEIVNAITSLANQLGELETGVTEVEKQQNEKRFLTPRMSRQLMADDWAWHNPVAIGQKEERTEEKQPNDWISAMGRVGLKPKERRNQHWKNYTLSGWYPRSWFE